MKRLLIITSEELNPQNILASTFELSQAQILSEIYEVAILSVTAYDSFSAKFKQLFKKSFDNNKVKRIPTFKLLLKELKQMFLFLALKKKIVNKYIIEGVQVYEGTGYFFISTPDFSKNLDVWIKAGYNAFDFFCKENGLPDIIHAHGRFLNAGALALAIKKKNKIPYIYTEHSTYFQRGLAPAESKPVLAAVISEACFFTTVSASLLHAVSAFLEDNFPNAKVVPNVMDTIFESPVAYHFNREGEPFTFLTVASLDFKKGVDILLHAFKKAFAANPAYKLIIAGNGPLRDDLENLRNSLELNGSVSFLGTQTKYAVKELMDGANVFVLPSRVETFGVVVIEALSRGCPVIATKSGGPEYIVNEASGIIIDAGNEEQLAGALKSMVVNYTSYSRENMHTSAINKYGSKTFLNTMNDLYDKALAFHN